MFGYAWWCKPPNPASNYLCLASLICLSLLHIAGSFCATFYCEFNYGFVSRILLGLVASRDRSRPNIAPKRWPEPFPNLAILLSQKVTQSQRLVYGVCLPDVPLADRDETLKNNQGNVVVVQKRQGRSLLHLLRMITHHCNIPTPSGS
jgi:hypothetical protein